MTSYRLNAVVIEMVFVYILDLKAFDAHLIMLLKMLNLILFILFVYQGCLKEFGILIFLFARQIIAYVG